MHPVGAEKTVIGPIESVVFSSRIFFRIFGMPFPSTSSKLPPNFAIESFDLTSFSPYYMISKFILSIIIFPIN